MGRRSVSFVRGDYSICRLAAGVAVPGWATRGAFFSITSTEQELSIVCASEFVPEGVRRDDGWAAIMLEGPIPFEETGVLAGIASTLAEAGLSVFAVSTFDTDVILVRSARIQEAADALAAAGYSVAA